MNRSAFLASWDHLRTMHGITARLVEAIPADRIDSHPIPHMRTPKELIFHLYGQIVRDVAQGLVTGEIRQTEDAVLDSIKSKADLVRFVADCWNEAHRAAQSVTDAQLAATLKTPWGMDMPAAMAWTVINDEYLHHRGQLFAYLRALGQEVPMIWDFEHNAPDFRPKVRVAG